MTQRETWSEYSRRVRWGVARKRPAMAEPVGDPANNQARFVREYESGERRMVPAKADVTCGRCNYLVCSCAPFAPPALAAPQPTAAPATPHVWAAGQWAKCVTNRITGSFVAWLTIGKAYDVVSVDEFGQPIVVNDEGHTIAYAGKLFTPATAPARPSDCECARGLRCVPCALDGAPATAPAPAGEREWTPPAPWVVDSDGDYGYGAKYSDPRAMQYVMAHRTSFAWGDHARKPTATGAAPTLAQACCSALSIELHELSPTQGYYAAHPSFTDGPVAYGRDAEDCAKAALEAHARLEPAPAVESERG
jgi:hypothetical protein